MGLRSNWERDPQFGNIVPGAFTPVLAKYSKSSVPPPIFQGPNGCTPARFLSGCGPEVVQKSSSGRSPGISFLDRESVGEVGLPPHCRLFTNLLECEQNGINLLAPFNSDYYYQVLAAINTRRCLCTIPFEA